MIIMIHTEITIMKNNDPLMLNKPVKTQLCHSNPIDNDVDRRKFNMSLVTVIFYFDYSFLITVKGRIVILIKFN